MNSPNPPSTVALRMPLFRGAHRVRNALVGMPNAGKSTLFNAVASTAPTTGKLGRPMVIALNMADQAARKGLHLKVKALSGLLGMPVVSTVATMGHGIAALFAAAVDAHRDAARPLPQLPGKHILDGLDPLARALDRPEIAAAFRVPHAFLLTQFAAGNKYFEDEFGQHFPHLLPDLLRLRDAASQTLPWPLDEELHADRHHRAAILFESGTRIGGPHEGRGWRYWLDELFLLPQGG